MKKKGLKPSLTEAISKPEWLTVKQTAKLLQVSDHYIYKLLKDGTLPGAKQFGGLWRIHRATFELFKDGNDS